MSEWLKDGLSLADSAFAVLGVLIGLSIKPLRRRWQRRSSVQRKQQTQILDQLDLGRPLETIESALGRPHLLNRWKTPDGEGEERIYRLPGAWVVLEAPEGAVAAYSITITDAELCYDTGAITRGMVPVCLGRSVFADAATMGADDALEIYAHFVTFHRHYDYGSIAAGGRFIWLAFNPGGVGDFDGASAGDWQQHTTSRARAVTCDLSRITVNTIAVCDWDMHSKLLDPGFYGPHPDRIR